MNMEPTNSLVNALLTDLYQITMTYGQWLANRHNQKAVFELFFRKNPFKGQYTIFCGLDQVLKYASTFHFTKSDIEYLKSTPALCHCDPKFFDEYLMNLDCSQVVIHSMKEGSVAFPRVPLLIITGPLGITQLLETALLNLVNYSSLVATNAARMVIAARGQYGDILINGKRPKLAEFGLRRAQGPDGAMSASKYSLIGGFDSTSNVLAGKLFNVPISGTHAHAFVQSYTSLQEVQDMKVPKCNSSSNEDCVTLLPIVLHYRSKLGEDWMKTNDGELAAFIGYAAAFPESFLCLIDTYDTLKSGIKNFILVALALNDCGYNAKGVRLDSGDLSVLSLECYHLCSSIAEQEQRPFLKDIDIVASNDINEEILHEMNKKGHAVTIYGIGTNLVTCQAQPALGCVYKLVELNGKPRIKLSNDLEKVLIPGKKVAYRFYNASGYPDMDLLMEANEVQPQPGEEIKCFDPYKIESDVLHTPSRIEPLHSIVWNQDKGVVASATLNDAKMHAGSQIQSLHPDTVRLDNPKKHKVFVTQRLYDDFHALWESDKQN